MVRRRRGRPAPEPWPDWVWAGLVDELGTAGSRPATQWCKAQGYNGLQILWLVHAHQSVLFGQTPPYWLWCPCPVHRDGSAFPAPEELNGRFGRSPRRTIHERTATDDPDAAALDSEALARVDAGLADLPGGEFGHGLERQRRRPGSGSHPHPTRIAR
jgi:hypothetical protein